MDFTDTHCHLQFDSYKNHTDEILSRAAQAGVKRFMCIGTNLKDSNEAAELAKRYKTVWAAAGVHPHDAEAFLNDPVGRTKLSELLKEPKIAAVGEIGLDYYKDYTPRSEQEKALRVQIEVGLPTSLPFIFHVRDSWSDFWRIFDEYQNLRGVVHSFSSGVKQLNAALERGLYIGLNGIMTFTKDQAQLEAARQVPNDRLVLETDAPFLTPAPFRDELCEPRHVVTTAEFLANLRGQPIAELSKNTTDNAVRLFKLA